MNIEPAPRSTGEMPNCENAVEWLPVRPGPAGAQVEISRFQGSGGAVEYHVTIRWPGAVAQPAETLAQAWRQALQDAGIPPSSTVMRRVFCSDVLNQAGELRGFEQSAPGGFSVIGQTPVPAAKLALWSQHLVDSRHPAAVISDGTAFLCRRGELTHHWLCGMTSTSSGKADGQTRRVLEMHGAWLDGHGMNLADHVIRTWWFVRQMDIDYQGLVDARREYFHSHGLHPGTHYIASTGIAGAASDLGANLSLDSYAIAGLQAAQVEYLQADGHLCPTQDYGVTFERATAVTYADRKHIFLSGTASIDHAGNIVHPGDVLGQLDRTLENIVALLERASANLGDLAMLIVYLRDPSDVVAVEASLRDRLGPVPMVMVHAPVCRPGWLVEIEGLAITACQRSDLPAY